MSRHLARIVVSVVAAMAVATGGVLATAGPAAAHVGDLCTPGGCAGSASFVKDGDHLYVWDNSADGHSVVVVYYRTDACSLTKCQEGQAWNHFGEDITTPYDHNMDMPEDAYISYKVCLGEYASRNVLENTCSQGLRERAS